MIWHTLLFSLLTFDLGRVINAQQPKVGDLVSIPGRYRYERRYYHDVPFDWVNDAEVQIMSRPLLRQKLQKIRQTLADRDLINNKSDNMFRRFMISPYEAFRQGRGPKETPGQWTTRWITDYCGDPYDAFCFFILLGFVVVARLLRSIQNWHFLRRPLHPSGFLNTLPHVHLADLQETPVERTCRPDSRWSLPILARKFRITLSQESSDLVEIYYRNEERNPRPDPWMTLKTVMPWLKQYKRLAHRDKSILSAAEKYTEQVEKSKREKNEMRAAIFQKIKDIESKTPLTTDEKIARHQGMINRDQLREETRRQHGDVAASLHKQDEMRRSKIKRVETRLERIKKAISVGKPPPASYAEVKKNWEKAGALAKKQAKTELKRRQSTGNPKRQPQPELQ